MTRRVLSSLAPALLVGALLAPPASAAPGYVVRASDVFRVAGDTVQLHLAAERYRTPQGDPQEALSFEKVYKLAARGDGWRVVGEARAP